jgi:hypothetical protein
LLHWKNAWKRNLEKGDTMIELKRLKKLHELCVKISNLFEECYIVKDGTIVSLDPERPSMLQITPDNTGLFSEYLGDESETPYYYLSNLKDFKVSLKESIEKYEEGFTKSKLLYIPKKSTEEKNAIMALIAKRKNAMTNSTHWKKFLLSNDPKENEKLIDHLFKKNSFIEFVPDNAETAFIILTKPFIPMVTEKNYTSLYYSTEVAGDNLFLLMFDIDLPLFRLSTFHYYVGVTEDGKP